MSWSDFAARGSGHAGRPGRNLINGVLLSAGLQLIGLDFAVLFAVFSSVLILIPYFGTPLGAIPPVVYGLSQSPGTALVVLAIYVGVHAIESYVTIPLVMQTVSSSSLRSWRSGSSS